MQRASGRLELRKIITSFENGSEKINSVFPQFTFRSNESTRQEPCKSLCSDVTRRRWLSWALVFQLFTSFAGSTRKYYAAVFFRYFFLFPVIQRGLWYQRKLIAFKSMPFRRASRKNTTAYMQHRFVFPPSTLYQKGFLLSYRFVCFEDYVGSYSKSVEWKLTNGTFFRSSNIPTYAFQTSLANENIRIYFSISTNFLSCSFSRNNVKTFSKSTNRSKKDAIFL